MKKYHISTVLNYPVIIHAMNIMDKHNILLIDDNDSFLDLFCNLAAEEGFNITPLTSAQEALNNMETDSVDLIVSDVAMPGMDGIELFKKVQDTNPNIPFIILTAFGSTEKAIDAVKQGAFHYFEKPINGKMELIWATFREALLKTNILKEITSLQREKSFQEKKPMSILGQSEGIKEVLASIEEVADLPVTVLVLGETGTGKELVARAIHHAGKRRNSSFFAVNCNELAPGVLESELFGHEKGAFTGAITQKKGLFEVSDQGTLLLDEIGDATPSLQSKLLRVIESREFTRVGGTATVSPDFRIITATNKNLEENVANGSFRQDLFYRLNVYVIDIPPLRERKEDIWLIAEYYLNHFSQNYQKSIERLSESALLSLRDYDWPGNVRELINVIERAVITCKGSIVTTEHLPFGETALQKTSDLNLKEIEKVYIKLALKRTDSNRSHAAELLGINRRTLFEKMKKYEICEV